MSFLNVLQNSPLNMLINEESLEIYHLLAEKIELLLHVERHVYLYHIYRSDMVMIFLLYFNEVHVNVF